LSFGDRGDFSLVVGNCRKEGTFGEEYILADCGRGGGWACRRRSAKRRERLVRQDRRGVQGGLGERGAFAVVGGRIISVVAPVEGVTSAALWFAPATVDGVEERRCWGATLWWTRSGS